MSPSSRAAVLAVSSLLLAAVAWWCWRDSRAAAPPDVGTAANANASAAAPGSDAPASAAAALPPAERAEAPTPVRAVAAPSGALEVRGRCVAAEDGAPVATVDVQVAADDPAAAGGAEAGTARTTTAADGRFSLRIDGGAARALRVEFASAGRVVLTARRSATPAATTADTAAPTAATPSATTPADVTTTVWELGDVALPASVRVHGEVVDAAGAPVEGVRVRLVNLRQDGAAARFRAAHEARSDARGAFAFAEPLAVAEWWVAVDGVALRAPRTLQLPRAAEHFVRVEIERPDPAQAITGRVVDDLGAPLGGIELLATGDGSMGQGRSAADGRFTIDRAGPHHNDGKRGVELGLRGETHDRVRPRAGEVVAWGQRDVEVVAMPLGATTLRALDGDGATVRGDVVVARASPGALLVQPRERQRVLADGAIVVGGLRAGDHAVWFTPHTPGAAPFGPVPFVASGRATPPEVRFVVPAAVALAVRVVLGDGAPAAGSEVELITAAVESLLDAERPAPPLASANTNTNASSLRGARQLAVARAVSDERGAALLSATPGRYLLRARGIAHTVVARGLDVAPGLGEVVLVATTAASVRGRLEPIDAVASQWLDGAEGERRMSVTARTPDGRAALATADVAPDGTFVLGPLPPGRVRLFWHTWLVCNADHAGRLPGLLAELELGALPVERAFDVRALLPGRATGRVQLDGAPFARQQFFLQRTEPTAAVRVTTDANGAFATRVPPGEYRVRLAVPSEPGPGHHIVPLPPVWTVRAGAVADVAVDARLGTLRLRVLTAAGAPVAAAPARVRAEAGYYRPGALATGADGLLVLWPAPHGEFTVVLAHGGRDHELGPFVVPAHAAELVVERRLPD